MSPLSSCTKNIVFRTFREPSILTACLSAVLGVTTNRHPGNEIFRSLVGLNKVYSWIPKHFVCPEKCRTQAFGEEFDSISSLDICSMVFFMICRFDKNTCIRFSAHRYFVSFLIKGTVCDKYEASKDGDFEIDSGGCTLLGPSGSIPRQESEQGALFRNWTQKGSRKN